MQSRVLWLAAAAALAACGSGDDGAGIDANDPGTGVLVTVSLAGNGSGTVTSSPGGIACPDDCEQRYPPGTSLTLHAQPVVGGTFVGWTAGGCTGTGDCRLAVAADLSVEATFSMDRSLTVVMNGTGIGTVTSEPAGIDCPSNCTGLFGDQSNVVLTAAAGASSTFNGWIGAGCTGTGTCTVTMTQNLTLTARFTGSGFLCTQVNNATGCSSGAIPEINLGALTATECHDQCQAQMPGAGMTSGCWIVALNGVCYCRSGTLTVGAVQPGGVCG